MERMTMKEFVDVYCSDIKTQEELFGKNEYVQFNHDDIDEEGEPIIYDEKGHPIRVQDIMDMDFEEFKKFYPSLSSEKALEKYMEAYDVVIGMDVLFKIQNEVQKEKEKIDNFNSLGINFGDF